MAGIALACPAPSLRDGRPRSGWTARVRRLWTCQKCHFKEYGSWQKTKMAMAFNALCRTRPPRGGEGKSDPAKDYTKGGGLVACHVTGYGKPGGYPEVGGNDEEKARAADGRRAASPATAPARSTPSTRRTTRSTSGPSWSSRAPSTPTRRTARAAITTRARPHVKSTSPRRSADTHEAPKLFNHDCDHPHVRRSARDGSLRDTSNVSTGCPSRASQLGWPPPSS